MQKLILQGSSGKVYRTSKKYIRIGIVSIVKKKPLKHIILLDYDNYEPTADLIKLQDKYKLPNFYIFETSKGRYSAMCFYPVCFRKYAKILRDSLCDSKFKYYTLRSRMGTIRVTKKPEKKTSILKLKKIILSDYKNILEDYKCKSKIFKLIELNGGSVCMKN